MSRLPQLELPPLPSDFSFNAPAHVDDSACTAAAAPSLIEMFGGGPDGITPIAGATASRRLEAGNVEVTSIPVGPAPWTGPPGTKLRLLEPALVELETGSSVELATSLELPPVPDEAEPLALTAAPVETMSTPSTPSTPLGRAGIYEAFNGMQLDLTGGPAMVADRHNQHTGAVRRRVSSDRRVRPASWHSGDLQYKMPEPPLHAAPYYRHTVCGEFEQPAFGFEAARTRAAAKECGPATINASSAAVPTEATRAVPTIWWTEDMLDLSAPELKVLLESMSGVTPAQVNELKIARRKKRNRMYARRSRQRRQSGTTEHPARVQYSEKIGTLKSGNMQLRASLGLATAV